MTDGITTALFFVVPIAVCFIYILLDRRTKSRIEATKLIAARNQYSHQYSYLSIGPQRIGSQRVDPQQIAALAKFYAALDDLDRALAGDIPKASATEPSVHECAPQPGRPR